MNINKHLIIQIKQQMQNLNDRGRYTEVGSDPTNRIIIVEHQLPHGIMNKLARKRKKFHVNDLKKTLLYFEMALVYNFLSFLGIGE